MAKKPETIDHLDLAIARWETRLKVAMTKLSKLKLKRKRLALKIEKANETPQDRLIQNLPPVLGKLVGEPAEERLAANAAALDAMAEVAAKAAEPPPGFMELAGAGIVRPAGDDGLAIPTFLQRGAAAIKEVDELIASKIRAEQDERKAAKARGRIAKMKAKQSGETKKMPLSGRAALAALRD